MYLLSRVGKTQPRGGLVCVSIYSPLRFMISGRHLLEVFGLVLIGLQSNSETRVQCLGLNLAPARNHSIPHTHTHSTHRGTGTHTYTHTFIHTSWEGGQQRQQMEKLFWPR